MNNNIDFEKIKQQILPYFVSVYGEQYKDIILERLNRIIPAFYSSIDGRKAEMYRQNDIKQLELTFKFLELNGFNISDELKLQCYRDNNTDAICKDPEIDEFLTACFGKTSEYTESSFGTIRGLERQQINSNFEKELAVLNLRAMGVDVTSENYNDWVLSDESIEIFNKINGFKQQLQVLDSEYKTYLERYTELNAAIEKKDQLSNKIQEKYMFQFLESVKTYMNQHDRELMDDYINSNNKDWFLFSNSLDILKIVGSSFSRNGLADAFSADSELKLNNEKTSSYTKQTIIRDRMKYYDMIGINANGLPPEEFIHTQQAIEYAPKREVIDEIISKKGEYAKLVEKELLIASTNYKDRADYLEQFDLLDDSTLRLSDIPNKALCIKANAIDKGDRIEAAPVLVFSPESCVYGYADVALIHELNHAIELDLLRHSELKKGLLGVNLIDLDYKCGFEHLRNYEVPGEDNCRNYELFSEVINQKIAMEVTGIMHKNNAYVFDNPVNSKIKGSTSYEQKGLLIENFYQTFKDQIIASRVSSSLEPLFNAVGRDNFDKLNNIINEYNSLPYYQLMHDIRVGDDSEIALRGKKLIAESQQVFEEMCKYSNQQTYNETSGYSR